LPQCNPGGCEEGEPLRQYINCRLDNIATSFAANWREGDILFMGDSNTDIATAYNIFPILPRAFNAAVLGSRICDVTASMNRVQGWINSLAESGAATAPSSLVVMVGTNDLLRDVNGVDNKFTPATAEKYRELFARMVEFRSANGGEVVVRSVLPGIPDYSGCCTDGYIPDAIAYKHAVLDANAFLGPLCADNGFIFDDDYHLFWNHETDNIRKKLYRGGTWYNPCTQADFSDYLHLGCSGQRVALGNLSRLLYAKPPASEGSIPSITAPPFGPPEKSNAGADPAMMYRYLHHKVAPQQRIELVSRNSDYNYAALFEPGAIGGLPLAESKKAGAGAESAKVHWKNEAEDDVHLVLILGTDLNAPGEYEIGLS